jgi:tetratricopeptide (TPR) repeat protein
MGVVYEAEQLSLGRRVALKVLPFAAALDPKRLRRFQNEAQAAAHLDHPHIVAVYAVGCERGVHYYAMQLIDGVTLAELIRQLQRPDANGTAAALPPTTAYVSGQEPASPVAGPGMPPSKADTVMQAALSAQTVPDGTARFALAARLGIQAAEALEYAHEQGVIHRDVKPANLLVDVRGKMWVTDFGLAQFHADAGLTMTGDLMGTLRYMSPEQAMAKRVVLDHRTDVYSLGVTLYELLALEPPFQGEDRQEVLRQVLFEEPRPLRQVNKQVPADLETIVLKCLEKNPNDRYATAQELADDLRRFLEHRPIYARRPTLRQRLGKWARRHQGVVKTGLAGLVAAVVLLACSTFLIWQEKGHAETNAKEARDQQRQAERNFQLALDAVDQYFTKVSESPELKSHSLEKLRRGLLQTAQTFYEEFIRRREGDRALSNELGNTYLRLAMIQDALGSKPDAVRSAHQAVALFQELASAHPGLSAYQKKLADSYICLAQAYLYTDRQNDAVEPAYRQAIALREGLAHSQPNDPQGQKDLAQAYSSLAHLLGVTRRRSDLDALYGKAVPLQERLVREYPHVAEYRFDLAFSYNHWGNHYRDLSYTPKAKEVRRKAEDCYRKAIALRQGLVDEYPGIPDYRRDLAITCLNQAFLHRRFGEWTKAETYYQQALPLLERLAREHPDVPGYRMALGRNYMSRASALTSMRRYAEAEESVQKAIGLQKQLVHGHAEMIEHICDLCLSYRNLGDLCVDTRRIAEAESAYQKVLELNAEIEKRFPGVSHYQRNSEDSYLNHIAWKLATHRGAGPQVGARAVEFAKRAAALKPQTSSYWNTLGAAHYRAGDSQAAVAALEKSMSLSKGGDSSDWFFLAMAHWQLGDKAQARKWYDQAVAWMEKRRPNDGELRRFRAEAAALLGEAELIPPPQLVKEANEGPRPAPNK